MLSLLRDKRLFRDSLTRSSPQITNIDTLEATALRKEPKAAINIWWDDVISHENRLICSDLTDLLMQAAFLLTVLTGSSTPDATTR